MSCLGAVNAGGTNEDKASREHEIQLDFQQGASNHPIVDDDKVSSRFVGAPVST